MAGSYHLSRQTQTFFPLYTKREKGAIMKERQIRMGGNGGGERKGLERANK
jgi:hypothetical protein